MVHLGNTLDPVHRISYIRLLFGIFTIAFDEIFYNLTFTHNICLFLHEIPNTHRMR